MESTKLPDKKDHEVMLLHLKNMYWEVSEQLPPGRDLDAQSVEESRIIMVKNLSRIARALG